MIKENRSCCDCAFWSISVRKNQWTEQCDDKSLNDSEWIESESICSLSHLCREATTIEYEYIKEAIVRRER